jgi:hypothetical protein
VLAGVLVLVGMIGILRERARLLRPKDMPVGAAMRVTMDVRTVPVGHFWTW